MIDFDRLYRAYENKGFYALQLEVGDKCYQGCIYCYMNALEKAVNTLTDRQIKAILIDADRLGVTAIEWLGGEPLLRESIFDHMALTAELGMRNNIWTGGLPFRKASVVKAAARYASNGLIALHVSSIDPQVYKKLHPEIETDHLSQILNGLRELLNQGYPASRILNSVTFTGLQAAEDMIATIDYFEKEFNIKTTLNVYHTYLRPDISRQELAKFVPSPRAVAKVYKRYAKQWGVRQFPMNCVNKQYCSATLAVLCDGSVTPCATIREPDAPNIHQKESLYSIANANRDHLVFNEFRNKKNIPQICQQCKLNDQCFGCRSRAYAAGAGLYGPDPRCYKSKKSYRGI